MVPLPNAPLGWTAGFASQSDGRRHRTYDREGSTDPVRLTAASGSLQLEADLTRAVSACCNRGRTRPPVVNGLDTAGQRR
jgi:hypothetical protein